MRSDLLLSARNVIMVGIFSLLTVVTLRQDLPFKAPAREWAKTDRLTERAAAPGRSSQSSPLAPLKAERRRTIWPQDGGEDLYVRVLRLLYLRDAFRFENQFVGSPR